MFAHIAVVVVLLLPVVRGLEYDLSTCRNTSLARSTWPSDHGDSSRTKYTLGAGLPADFDPKDLKMMQNTDLKLTQWAYTAGENSEFLYTMSGAAIKGLTVSKSNAVTLEVMQSVSLEPGLYIGGMLMHANGHVYCVHANSVTAYWNGDLFNSTRRVLPTRLNGRLVQTNGVIVTSDGLLAIKQWALIPEDMFLYIYSFLSPPLVVVLAILMLTGVAIMYSLTKKLKIPFPMYFGLTFGLLLGAFFVVLVFMGLMCLLGFYPYDPVRFLSTNTFRNDRGGGGELKLIDPLSLEVRAEIFLEERCSFARMAMSALPNGEDGFVLLGDEFVHQYRWNAATGALYEVSEWASRYRTRWGTFPGTGPAIYNHKAFFTDNTFAVNLFGKKYNLFSIDLLTPRDHASAGTNQQCSATGSCDMPRLSSVSLTNDTSGFMYWSVTVSPANGDVIVWDTAGGSVQCRRADDLSLRWSVSAWQGDCISVAADKGHVYFSDYSEAPKAWYNWMRSAGPAAGTQYDHVVKYFIVAGAEDGRIIANVTASTGGVKPALIVPGGNNDVFFPTPGGLVRVFV